MGLLRPRRSLREQHRSVKFILLRNEFLAIATSLVSQFLFLILSGQLER